MKKYLDASAGSVLAILLVSAQSFAYTGEFPRTTPRPAQSEVSSLSSYSITLVLKERFGDSTLTAIVRRNAGVSGGTIVALRRDALTPELLGSAVRALTKSHAKHGDQLTARVDIVFHTGASRAVLSPALRQWATTVISLLRTAPAKDVAGAGRVPTITVTVDAASTQPPGM